MIVGILSMKKSLKSIGLISIFLLSLVSCSSGSKNSGSSQPCVEHNFEIKRDSSGHWQRCVICGYETEKVNHDFSTGRVYMARDPQTTDHPYHIVEYHCDFCDINHEEHEDCVYDVNNAYTYREPSYEREGIIAVDCELCHSHIYLDTLPQLEHTYYESYEHNDTYHWHMCKDPGYETLHSPYELHAYGEWVIDLEPTWYIEGKKHRSCVCGVTEYADIDSGAIDYAYRVLKLSSNSYGGYSVIGTNEKIVGELVIPETYGRYPINVIASSSLENQTEMTSVHIPSSIIKIEDEAFEGCSGISEVTIPNSVSEIGTRIFDECTALETVTLSNKLSALPYATFRECSSLKSIGIPDSINTIGREAFSYSGLERIIISNNVRTIEDEAFEECRNLKLVTLGKGITSFGNNVFNNANSNAYINIYDNLREKIGTIGSVNINYHGTLSNYLSLTIDQNSFSPKSVHLYLDEEHEDVETTDLVIPSSFSVIKRFAFYRCGGLKSITFEDSDYQLGMYVFYCCSSLQTINFGNGKKTCENGLILMCDSLCQINLTGSFDIQIVSGDEFISNCLHLVEIINTCNINFSSLPYGGGITNTDIRVISDESSSLLKTSADEFVYLDEGSKKTLVNYIGSEKEITVPSYITDIRGEAFYELGLTEVNIDYPLNSVGKNIFHNNNQLVSVNFNSTINSFANEGYVFYTTSVEHVKLPDNLTVLKGFFYNCDNLKNIDLPETLLEVGSSAFSNCSSLESLTFPDSVTIIANNAIYECENLKSVTFGKGVSSNIDALLLKLSYLEEVNFSVENVTYKSIGGVIYSYNGENLISSCKSVSENYTVLDGTVTIRNSAFKNNKVIKSVVVSGGVTKIEQDAFYGCSNLVQINLPNTVTEIGKYAFHMANLSSISFPNGLEVIEEYVVATNRYLTRVEIPASVTTIKDYAFYYCYSIEEFVYLGTIAQWNAINKQSRWNDHTSFTVVHCSDGDIFLN